MTDQKTLMIVDDSRVSRMMIKAIVVAKYPHWALLEAGNAEQALALSQDKSIDYFSLDLNMPGMDGLELLAALKPSFSNAKFSLMTANIQQTIYDKASKFGAACTHKPITEDSVTNMLDFFNDHH